MGFTSPLIMKVAAEIKSSFPDIFDEADELTDFWVYNYDNNDLLSGGENGGASEFACPIMQKAERDLNELSVEVMEAKAKAEAAPADEALRTALVQKEIELQVSSASLCVSLCLSVSLCVSLSLCLSLPSI